MAATARQKRSYLHHQGEFQHQNCTVGTVHDSDHDGVVRIFVRHSCHSNELFILFNYITRHNFSPTRSVTRGNRTPGSRVATGCSSTIAQTRYCNTFQLTHIPREDHERSRRSIELSQQWRPKEIEKTRNLLYSAHNFASPVSFGM